MRIHIVSLQRTGSKSLVKALSNFNTLHDGFGSDLSEFLHGWSEHGYKFGLDSDFPFDKNSKILFRTNSKFENTLSINYEPVISGYKVAWLDSEYKDTWAFADACERKSMTDHITDLVLKTQLVDMGFTVDQNLCLTQGFDVTVGLYPTDTVAWVISNYLAETTGIFVPIKEQLEAVTSPVTVPLDYAIALKAKLARHHDLLKALQLKPNTRTLMLPTESLSKDETHSFLTSYLGDKVLPVENIPEFRGVDVANIEDLKLIMEAP